MNVSIVSLLKKSALFVLPLFFLLLFFFLATSEQNKTHAACSTIADGAERAYCWQDKIVSYARGGNVHEAFETLLELYTSDPELAPDCHGYAHSIGEEAADAFVRTGTTTLSELSSLCGYGFYHGFMETVVFMTGDLERMRDFCGYVDEKLSASGLKGWLYACYHGFGHGITDGSDPRTWGDPQEMIQPALRTCAEITETSFLESRCATGAFNALEILSQDSRYELAETLGADPYDVCHTQPLLYREPCYTNMVIAVLRLYDNDVEESARYIIQNIPRPDDPTEIGGTVFEKAISALASEFMRLYGKEPDYKERGISLCRSVPSAVRDACIEGLSYGHIQYGVPSEEYRAWLAFCGSNALTEHEQDVCYRFVLTRLPVLYIPVVAREICALAGESYAKRYCSDTYFKKNI